jgi:uncharacterized protein (TIGR02271 family)
MTRTITGLFDTREAAEAVIDHLVTHDGVERSQITLHHSEGAGTADSGQDEGFWASLKSLFVPDEDRHAYSEGIRRGGYMLSAELDEDRVTHAMDVFEEHGAVDLDAREEEWRSSGWKGYGSNTSSDGALAGGMGAGAMGAGGVAAGSLMGGGMTPATHSAEPVVPVPPVATTSDMSVAPGILTPSGVSNDAKSSGSSPTGTMSGSASGSAGRIEDGSVIPVVAETLRVGKRDTENGRVRVRSYVVETPVTEQVSLRQEHVDVQRRPVDRPLTDADTAFQDRTIEAVEHGEEAVVSKEARVVEEVVLNKDATERTETVHDTVRRQEVEVEDTRTGKSTPMPQNPL